jgi:hypothetical protein
MKKLFAAAVLFTLGMLVDLHPREGPPTALAGGPACATENGDANADGRIDLSDAVTILGNLFLGKPPQLPPLCASSRTGLPDTGQNQCFDCEGKPVGCKSCLGQPRPCDGFLQPSLSLQDSMQRTGCANDASRFTDNGDGTVTDNCTGLQWLQDSVETPDDDLDGHPDPVTWCKAMEFCNDLVFADHSDWRLPNVRELQSLVDYGRFAPAIAPEFRLAGNRTAEGNTVYDYWTSTSYIEDPKKAFAVRFQFGSVFFAQKVTDIVSGAEKLRLLAVRG